MSRVPGTSGMDDHDITTNAQDFSCSGACITPRRRSSKNKDGGVTVRMIYGASSSAATVHNNNVPVKRENDDLS